MIEEAFNNVHSANSYSPSSFDSFLLKLGFEATKKPLRKKAQGKKGRQGPNKGAKLLACERRKATHYKRLDVGLRELAQKTDVFHSLTQGA